MNQNSNCFRGGSFLGGSGGASKSEISATRHIHFMSCSYKGLLWMRFLTSKFNRGGAARLAEDSIFGRLCVKVSEVYRLILRDKVRGIDPTIESTT